MKIINFVNAQVNVPSPSQYIKEFLSNPKGETLTIFFQGLYNFLFALFIALAFLYFVYGALQYLLSGAGIFSKEEGKKKMKNAVIAVIIVLIIPIIVNFINPEVYRGLEFYVPVFEIFSVGGGSGVGASFEYHGSVSYNVNYSPSGRVIPLNNLGLKNIWTNSGALVDESIVPALRIWDARLEGTGTKIRVTSGLRYGGAKCHSLGVCLDFVPEGSDNCTNLINTFKTTEGLRIGNNDYYPTTIETPGYCTNPNCCITKVGTGCELDKKAGVADVIWTCPGTTGYHVHMTFVQTQISKGEDSSIGSYLAF